MTGVRISMEELIARVRHFVDASACADAPVDRIALIAGGGSDRCFFRVGCGARSFVVMGAPVYRFDIVASVDVGRLLGRLGVGVPEILACDEAAQLVLLEDLGGCSLLQALQAARERDAVLGLYRSVLPVLADMQVRVTPVMVQSCYLTNRTFGYEALRWETDYFVECFLKRYCRMDIREERMLERECHDLAAQLAAEPRCFMHRDFQSTNIYLHDGRVRIIDFQTATRGLVHYDLASLLKDPYFPLPAGDCVQLAGEYCAQLELCGLPVADRDAFADQFHRAGLQRSMQALGAFAVLGMDRGKPAFFDHIPAGLALLRQGLDRVGEYPCLQDLTGRAVQILQSGQAATEIPASDNHRHAPGMHHG